jgi:membrane associated rhomboid family serine protease
VINLIPIHDENPTRRTPVVTWALIALNVVVFLLSPIAFESPFSQPSGAEACQETAFLVRWAAIPDELIDNAPLLREGEVARAGSCVIRADYEKSPVFSVLTAMFLHGGWLHLLGNMLFLGVFGNNVEDRLGAFRYLLFYLACGYVATYVFALSQPASQQPLVGASGAIAGVLGAYLILFPRARVTSLVPFLLFLPARLPAWVVLGSWFLLQWLYAQGTGVSDAGGVAYLAHIAGFIAGMVGVFLFGGVRSKPPPSDPRQWRPPTYYR